MAGIPYSLAVAFRSLALPAIVLLSACATTPENPLLPDEREALSGRRVAVIRRPLPFFSLQKKSDAWAGVVAAPFGVGAVLGAGAASMAYSTSRSDPFLLEYQLQDPAYGVAAQLGRTFGPAYGATFVGLTESEVEGKKPGAIFSALQGSADYSLDIQTDEWGLRTTIIGGYYFSYGASFFLMDLQDGTIVASGACRYLTPQGEARAFDELMRDGAAQLRVEIKSAQKTCAETFAQKILGEMPTAPVVPSKPKATHRHRTPR